MMDDLERRVREYVHEQIPWLPVEMPPTTDVVDDAKIYGDDVWELIEGFAKTFGVNLQNFRWYHHSGPEGCNPLEFRPSEGFTDLVLTHERFRDEGQRNGHAEGWTGCLNRLARKLSS